MKEFAKFVVMVAFVAFGVWIAQNKPRPYSPSSDTPMKRATVGSIHR